MTQYITRIAPSPSGFAHIGTIRTAYFNWLAARATGGKFIVRIDDTDGQRTDEKYIKPIFDSFDWLGLNYDSTFRQSDRHDIYRSIALNLVDSGLATVASNGAIILNYQDSFPKSWDDSIVGTVQITSTNVDHIDGSVLMRGDSLGGKATYAFASTVDDYVGMVNYVIRGVDHITNTSRQAAIWYALNQIFSHKRELPKFSHVGLLFANGKKISKRDGAASCISYKDNGVHPEALLNFLLRLGWSPTKDDKSTSTISTETAIKMFLSEGKMNASNANVDFIKLASFDRKYKGRDENIRRAALKAVS